MKINGNGSIHPFILKICYLLLLVIPFIMLGCGKDAVKPSEDSILAQGALRSLERIKEAYETKKLDSVRDLAGPELARNFKEELDFDKAALSFSTPRVIKITDSHVTISVSWQGVWERRGMTEKNRGASKFVFLKDSLKLVQIEGDNPFVASEANMQ